jgi:hypothetical protein
MIRPVGHDGQVTGGDLLSEATEELYSGDPDDFTERRGTLAARARESGQPLAAKQIAGLRKPTRSAWVLNQLVRADPDAASQLAALGDELRAAEGSMDGARIRELSLARRKLVESMVRRAFAVSGLAAPSASLREEVTATLGAALADPQVTEQLRAGTLVRTARWDGFGSAAAQTLTPVPISDRHRAPAAPPAAGPAAPASAAAAAPASTAADRARAEQERAQERRRQAIAAAQQAVAGADRDAETAVRAEEEQERAVALLERQLADARRRLTDARAQARRAMSAQRRARQALQDRS